MSLDPQIPDIFTKEGRELFRQWYNGPWDFIAAFGYTSLYHPDEDPGTYRVKDISIKDAKVVLALYNQAERILELLEKEEK